LPDPNRSALERLGALGVLRVVATGRSLRSLLGVLPPDTPLDFAAFSSGAGILRWSDRELLRARHLPAATAVRVARELCDLDADFMLHHAIPDNHRFLYRGSGRPNADFARRLALADAHGEPLPARGVELGPMCQAVVVEPGFAAQRVRRLRRTFADLSVVRATSPLDGTSLWLEIFAAGVNKSTAANWIVERWRPASRGSLAIGNDYNDADLLDWADLSFVVANAPPDLRRRHGSVASNDDGGFAEAVDRALGLSNDR
jgi:hydroxymethylpyrimidine pyrophosphatase-like HAD family hydrolase